MEVLIGFGIARIQLLTFLLMTGRAASSLNIKFWPWFVVGLFLPFISVVLILCRPVREKKVQQPLLKPVSSEEIFDQVLELEEPRRINRNGIQFLARA
jgi:membrane protein implicated in regulation of membrane protease activity